MLMALLSSLEPSSFEADLLSLFSDEAWSLLWLGDLAPFPEAAA